MKDFKNTVNLLKERNETIATMESCTGGGVANAITNIEHASSVLKVSVVTYSNEYKIKMGIKKETIDLYSVYSIEVAHEMAKNIKEYANSTYGVGITGKLKRFDKDNLYGEDDIVYFSIFDGQNYYDEKVHVTKDTRIENKDDVIEKIIDKLEGMLCEKDK